jgi:hypothetical protein
MKFPSSASDVNLWFALQTIIQLMIIESARKFLRYCSNVCKIGDSSIGALNLWFDILLELKDLSMDHEKRNLLR